MAWPPGVLPINRTDSVNQQTNHPGDHNLVNQAVNDTVTKLLAVDQTVTGSLAMVQARAMGSLTIASGNVDTGSTAMTDWLVYGTLVVPATATRAFVQVTVSGIYAPAAPANTSYSLRVRLGSTNGFAVAGTDLGVNNRFTVSWGESFNVTATGTVAIAVQAIRPASAFLRFDAASRVTFDVTYLSG